MHPSKHSFRPLLLAADPAIAAVGAEGKSVRRAADPGRNVTPDASAPRQDGRTSPHPESHVRLADPRRPGLGRVEWLEAQDLLDELGDEQLTLSLNLECLERARHARPTDPCAIAALPSIAQRIEDLGRVRDALARLQLATVAKSVHRALLPDQPLAEYLRGVYAWTLAIVRALDQLVAGLVQARPDWSLYRSRVEEATCFHFPELEDAIEEDLASLYLESDDAGSGRAAVRRVRQAFELLLQQARLLERRLAEGLG